MQATRSPACHASFASMNVYGSKGLLCEVSSWPKANDPAVSLSRENCAVTVRLESLTHGYRACAFPSLARCRAPFRLNMSLLDLRNISLQENYIVSRKFGRKPGYNGLVHRAAGRLTRKGPKRRIDMSKIIVTGIYTATLAHMAARRAYARQLKRDAFVLRALGKAQQLHTLTGHSADLAHVKFLDQRVNEETAATMAAWQAMREAGSELEFQREFGHLFGWGEDWVPVTV